MKFVGGKTRIVKDILPIILCDRSDRWYVEPFAGGFNVVCNVDGKRIASDANYYLIALFKAIQKGWNPPQSLSRQEYYDVYENMGKYDPYFVGFVGFACSYKGKWFGGYGGATRNGSRNYCDESMRALLKQSVQLQGVVIENEDYQDLYVPANSIIYCDPPYYNTVDAYGDVEFDSDDFWDWCVIMASKGHRVFVSEYTIPYGIDAECVWFRETYNSIDVINSSKSGIERLFLVRS